MGIGPLPHLERAARYLELMGRRDAVVRAAQDAFEAKDYTWASEILTYVIRVDKDDMEARQLKAEAFRQKAYTLINANWRNWFMVAAAELDGDVDISRSFDFTSADVILAFTTDKPLEMMTTRVDPEKSLDTHVTMGFKFEVSHERFALEIRRRVVQLHEGLPANVDFSLVLERSRLNRIMVGDIPITGEMMTLIEGGDPAPLVAVLAGIDAGDFQVESGSKDDVAEFFSYFDAPVKPSEIKPVVRLVFAKFWSPSISRKGASRLL